MAHKALSEKLDHIAKEELGYSFDEEMVWSRLEDRLDGKVVVERRWLIAACFFLIVFIAPFTLLEELNIQQPLEAKVEEGQVPILEEVKAVAEIPVIEQVQIEKMEVLIVESKGVEFTAITSINKLVPLPKQNLQIAKESQFAIKDISIIQASLEGPAGEKESGLSIRAQWQSSPTKAEANHQALEVKLKETRKKN